MKQYGQYFKLSIIICCLITWLAPVASGAEKEADFMHMSLEELMNIEVSVASKTSEKLLNTPGTVFVITEEDIRRYGWKNLREALRFVPGLDLKDYYSTEFEGGQRGFTSAESFDRSLLLIDGREFIWYKGQSRMWSGISTVGIKRIEILQGPSSSLYGANAAQGVINVVTKYGDQQTDFGGDTTEMKFLAGDVDTHQLSGIFRRREGELEIGGHFSYLTSDRDWDEVADSYYDTSISRDISKDTWRYLGPDFQNRGRAWAYDGHVAFRDFYAGFHYQMDTGYGTEYVTWDTRRIMAESEHLMYYLGWKHKFDNDLNLKAEVHLHPRMEQREAMFAPDANSAELAGYSDYDDLVANADWDENLWSEGPSRRQRYLVQADFPFRDRHNFTTGITHEKLTIEGGYVGRNYFWPPYGDSRETRSGWPFHLRHQDRTTAFVEDHIKLSDRWSVIAGVSYNYDSIADDDAWLPRVSLIWKPEEQSALKYTYGKAFYPPTTFNMKDGQVGSLEPEYTEMHELNFTKIGHIRNAEIANIMAIYWMEASNFMDHETRNVGGSTINYAFNSGEQQVWGIENMLRLKYDKLSAMVGIRYVNPEESTADSGKHYVKETPKNQYKAGLSYDMHEKMTVSLFLDYCDEIKQQCYALDGVSKEIITIDDWITADLNVNFGEYKLSERATAMLSVTVNNILDENYYHMSQRNSPIKYRQPPRTWWISAMIKY